MPKHRGNKFSHQNRLYELIFDENNGFSIDLFSGLLFGAFPYFDEDVYQANVHDNSIQGSVNLTANLKFEILNFAKFDLEVQVVPFLLGGGISWY